MYRHPPLTLLGNHSLGYSWMNNDVLAGGLPALWQFADQTTDIATGLYTTNFQYTPGGPNGGYSYAFPNDDNGRELTAQMLAKRIDTVMGGYDPTTSSQQGPDAFGVITLYGTLAGNVAEVRALKILQSAQGSSAVILLEVYSRNGQGINGMWFGLRDEVWSTV